MESAMLRNLERSEPSLGWVTYERRNWLGLVIVAGLAGFGIGNGHTTSGAIEHVSEQLGQKSAQVHKLETVTIPQLKAQTKCEHTRAIVIGKKAIAGDVEDPSDLPADSCNHQAVKP